MNEIKLPKALEVVVRPAIVKSIETINILFFVDSIAERKLSVTVKELPAPVVLWEREEYDAIGQWTDDVARARLIELISKK